MEEFRNSAERGEGGVLAVQIVEMGKSGRREWRCCIRGGGEGRWW